MPNGTAGSARRLLLRTVLSFAGGVLVACGPPSASAVPLSPANSPSMARIRPDSARAVDLGDTVDTQIQSTPEPEQDDDDGDDSARSSARDDTASHEASPGPVQVGPAK